MQDDSLALIVITIIITLISLSSKLFVAVPYCAIDMKINVQSLQLHKKVEQSVSCDNWGLSKINCLLLAIYWGEPERAPP